MFNKTLLKRLLFCVFTCLSLILITACMNNKDKSIPVYHCDSKQIKSIQVPANLNSNKIQDNYPMPKLTKPLSNSSNISLLPPGSSPRK